METGCEQGTLEVRTKQRHNSTDKKLLGVGGSKKCTYQRVSQWFRKQGGDNRRIEITISGTSKVFESKGDKDYDPWLERFKLSVWFRVTP